MYESPDWSDNTETVSTTALGATTERVAEQLAYLLVKEGSTARTTATVDIEPGPRAWTLIDALSLKGVPLQEGAELYSIEDTPIGQRLQVGSHDPIQKTIEDSAGG